MTWSKESQVSLTSASVEKVLMDPGHEDASGTVQNSLMDVGIANVSVANMLMDVRHETAYGVATTCPPQDVVVSYHTLVQDGTLPSGYESDFAELGTYIFPEADTQLRQLALLDNVSASARFLGRRPSCTFVRSSPKLRRGLFVNRTKHASVRSLSDQHVGNRSTSTEVHHRGLSGRVDEFRHLLMASDE